MVDTLPITFYSSNDLNEHQFWNKWMEYISTDNYLMKYYNDIIGEAELSIIDSAGKITKSVRLIGCYPTTLGAIEMGYDMTDQIATFEVSLIYHHYEIQDAIGIGDFY